MSGYVAAMMMLCQDGMTVRIGEFAAVMLRKLPATCFNATVATVNHYD